MSHGSRDVLVNNYSDLQTALDDVLGRLGVLEVRQGVRHSSNLTGIAAPLAVEGVSHSSGEILVSGFADLQAALDNISMRLSGVESRVSGVSSPSLSGSVARHAVADVSHSSYEIRVSNYSDLQAALDDILLRLTTLEIIFEPVAGRCGAGRNNCRAGIVNAAVFADTSSDYNWRCDGIHGGRNSIKCTHSRNVSYCGDGTCNSRETCVSCSRDCGRCISTPPSDGGSGTPPSGGGSDTPPSDGGSGGRGGGNTPETCPEGQTLINGTCSSGPLTVGRGGPVALCGPGASCLCYPDPDGGCLNGGIAFVRLGSGRWWCGNSLGGVTCDDTAYFDSSCNRTPRCPYRDDSRARCGATYYTACHGGCNIPRGLTRGRVCKSNEDCINGICTFKRCTNSPRCTLKSDSDTNCGAVYPTACYGGCDIDGFGRSRDRYGRSRLTGGTQCGDGETCRDGKCVDETLPRPTCSSESYCHANEIIRYRSSSTDCKWKTQECGQYRTCKYGHCVTNQQPERCTPGVQAQRSCSSCTEKTQSRTCLSNGKWSSWSSCICPPSTGPTTVRPCDFDPICSNKISSRTNCGAAYPTSCQGGCNKSAGRSGGIVCVTGQDCINGKCVRPPPPPPKCTHGQSETKNCDECPGRFSRRYCSSSGSWGSWSSCNCPERECTPGVRDSGSCPGCSEISRYRTCSSSGRWGGWSSCNCPERECTPGKREYKRCSECSTRFTYKRCSSSGSWGSWRSCNCPPPPTCDRSPSCSFRSNSRTKCGATYPTACQGGCDTSSRRLIGGTRCGIGQRCRSGSCEYVRSDGGACNTDFDCRSGYYCDGDTCVRS